MLCHVMSSQVKSSQVKSRQVESGQRVNRKVIAVATLMGHNHKYIQERCDDRTNHHSAPGLPLFNFGPFRVVVVSFRLFVVHP